MMDFECPSFSHLTFLMKRDITSQGWREQIIRRFMRDRLSTTPCSSGQRSARTSSFVLFPREHFRHRNTICFCRKVLLLLERSLDRYPWYKTHVKEHRALKAHAQALIHETAQGEQIASPNPQLRPLYLGTSRRLHAIPRPFLVPSQVRASYLLICGQLRCAKKIPSLRNVTPRHFAFWQHGNPSRSNMPTLIQRMMPRLISRQVGS